MSRFRNSYNFIVLVHNIGARHSLLRRTIGTRPEEDSSYRLAVGLHQTWTPLLLVCLVMEVLCYFLYTNKVSLNT